MLSARTRAVPTPCCRVICLVPDVQAYVTLSSEGALVSMSPSLSRSIWTLIVTALAELLATGMIHWSLQVKEPPSRDWHRASFAPEHCV